jgi:hypothetical protein
MSILLQILDEIIGTVMFAAIIIAIPMVIVGVPSFVLRRLPFDDPAKVAERYEKALGFMMVFSILGIALVMIAPIMVLLDHIIPTQYYLDATGNKVRIPNVGRASVVFLKLYAFLKSQGVSPTWSGVGSALVGLGSLIASLVGGFEVLSKFIKIVKNKAR